MQVSLGGRFGSTRERRDGKFSKTKVVELLKKKRFVLARTLVIVVILISFLWGINSASALFIPPAQRSVTERTATPIPSLWSLITGGISGMITGILGIFISIISQILAIVIAIFDSLITKAVAIPEQIKISWQFMVNFVNMFFILFLIIMAFGTIFDIEKYSWRNMLFGFIIVALLINFSFVIGEYLVTLANQLSAILLKPISALSISLANGLNLQNMTEAFVKSFNDPGGSVLAAIFQLIFVSFVLMSMIYVTVFVIVRVFAIWALLIICPLAMVGIVLPSIKPSWEKWTSNFISWVFFLPVYILFLSFAVIFINAKDEMVSGFNQGVSATSYNSVVANFFASSTIGDIFFYMLTLFFLVGGLRLAKKIGDFSGSQATAWFDKIQSKINIGAKKVGGFAVRHAPGSTLVKSTYEGGKEALEARVQRIKEKGIPFIVASEQEARLRKARIAEKLGGEYAKGAKEEAIDTEVNKEMNRVNRMNLSRDQLNAKFRSASGVEKMAIARIRADKGWITQDVSGRAEVEEILKQMGGGRSKTGSQFTASLDKNDYYERGFANVADKEAYADCLMKIDEALAKTVYRSMAKNKEVFNAALIEKISDAYAKDTLEIQKAVEKELIENITNIPGLGKPSERADAIKPTSRYSAIIQRLTAQVLRDKGEINDIATYENALRALNITDPRTAMGVAFDQKVSESNLAVVSEAKFKRKQAPPIPYSTPLTGGRSGQRLQVAMDLKDKFSSMSTENIKKISANDLKNSMVQYALWPLLSQIYNNPDQTERAKFLEGLDRNRRTGFMDIMSMTARPTP